MISAKFSDLQPHFNHNYVCSSIETVVSRILRKYWTHVSLLLVLASSSLTTDNIDVVITITRIERVDNKYTEMKISLLL